MQLLVFTMKPMKTEKRALGLQGDEYEKARICLQGQNHGGFQIHNSTNNADAHLLRLFLSVYASSKNVLASFDVSNAFLNAELLDEVTISHSTCSRTCTIWSSQTWNSVSMHQGLLWSSRSTETFGGIKR